MRLGSRLRAAAVGFGVAAVLAVAGTAFLTVAAYVGLLGVMPPALAALTAGAALLIAAASIAWATRRLIRPSGPGRGKAHPEAEADVVEQSLREHLDSMLGAAVRRHPVWAAVGTLLLGVAAGYLRSSLPEQRTGTRRGRRS